MHGFRARSPARTTPGEWPANTVVEICGKVQIANVPAAGSRVYVAYAYSGDVVDRWRGRLPELRDRSMFLDVTGNGATGWSPGGDSPQSGQYRTARDFLAFLRLGKGGEATLEILANRELARDVRAGQAALKSGKAKLIPWEKVKGDV